MRTHQLTRWALCWFCNGGGCRQCNNQGEHANEYDRTRTTR